MKKSQIWEEEVLWEELDRKGRVLYGIDAVFIFDVLKKIIKISVNSTV